MLVNVPLQLLCVAAKGGFCCHNLLRLLFFSVVFAVKGGPRVGCMHCLMLVPLSTIAFLSEKEYTCPSMLRGATLNLGVAPLRNP